MNDMQEAIEELETASSELAQRQVELSAARSNEISAVNRVNKAQKAIDDLIAEMKSEAPQGTDWRGR